jgi:gamma-glutamyltranspeptidase/glutathione hydrolase
VASPNSSVQSAAIEILGNGGGTGAFIYKGGGNAVDAVVAAALAACVVNPGNCSLGGYGGHMMIWKAGLDGDPQMLTCVDFNSAAGSLATSNMFAASLDPTTGTWTGPQPPANQYGWKAAGVPGSFAGLFMAQTNYGRKINGTNYFPFAEILKPALARVANGQATGNAYYTLTSVSNLLMDLYTNSPGYLDSNGQPNPNSVNNPYAVFYSGDIALDIVAAMQAYGGLVTYADMTNYRPRVVQPYLRHFSPPNGTPAWVCVAPLGASGLSVLEELAIVEALGWTNGPNGAWDSLHYWHSRAEAARLMWKDHFQWLGDPWSGILPPDFLGNGSTNFCDQMLAHATNGYPYACPWDTNEVRLTNSIASSITQAVNNETNVPILVHWNDIRYGTCNISTADKWGNCVALTFSMGGGFGAQVAVTNRGLVLGQGMALFDPRPGWPNSIAPGKRQVDNMCPTIVIPDYPFSPTNGDTGGRPPLAVGGVGGSTIENNMTMQVLKYLTDPPSSRVTDPATWLYNFEGNSTIYMRPSYPSGVQSYLATVGLSAPGGPPSAGEVSYVEAWVPPVIVTQPASTNVASGDSVAFAVTATGLPLFYQWLRNGVPLTDGGAISGAQTPRLTVASVTNSASYSVIITNGAASLTSASAGLSVDGAPAVVIQPVNRTNLAGTLATFSVTAMGTAPLAYQWLKNGANLANGGNISGATTSALSLDSITLGDAGTYSVMITNAVGSATSLGVTLAVMNSSNYLTLLWSVGPSDGKPWINISSSTPIPNQRTIAYNALSNHLYVISRSSSTTSNYVIYVLNATNGALLYTLKTNGIQSNVGKGGIGLVGISVADDGAIYACNTAPDAAGSGGTDPTSFFRLYRWANAGSNTSPSLIFTGDPSGTNSPLRWGDNLAVRGAGTTTQILLDMTFFGATPGTHGFAAILSPVNAFMTNFSSRWFMTTNFASTVGRSLEFDLANNAIWQKGPDQALFKTVFDPAVSLGGTRISSANVLVASNFPAGLMGVGLDLTRNLAAGVFSNSTATADSLNFYDISNVNAPSLLSQYDFPTIPRAANGNRITQTFFKNDLVFTLDANNGLMAFRVQSASSGAVKLTNFAKLANGTFQFAYSNNDNRTYSVFASTNLVDWQAIGAATQTSPGWFQFTDPEATNLPRRFYKLRSP